MGVFYEPGNLIYLASPYGHTDADVMDQRYTDTAKAVGKLVENGIAVISPIVHCHFLHALNHVRMTQQQYREYDLKILKKCDVLWVLKLEGWAISTGIRMECEFAREHAIPIKFITTDHEGIISGVETDEEVLDNER